MFALLSDEARPFETLREGSGRLPLRPSFLQSAKYRWVNRKSIICSVAVHPATNSDPYVNVLMVFCFLEKKLIIVWLRTWGAYSFPESPYERFGYFVGFSTSVGHSNTFKILDVKSGKVLFWSRVRLPKDVPNTRELKAYDTDNKPFDRGKGGKDISEKELSELAQAKFAGLNLPEKEETEKIGDVLVSELTPEDKDLIQRTGDHNQLVEDAKHPNLKQHPIPFLSDGRGGKLIPLPIEELVNRSFLLPIEKDGTRRRAVIKEVDSKAYEDYMNHIQ